MIRHTRRDTTRNSPVVRAMLLSFLAVFAACGVAATTATLSSDLSQSNSLSTLPITNYLESDSDLEYARVVSRTGADESGNGQFGTVNSKLENPVILRLVDASGGAAADVPVYFRVITEPEGTKKHLQLISDQKRTDEHGEYKADVVLGDKPGRYEVLFFHEPTPQRNVGFAKFEFTAQQPNWPNLLVLSLTGGMALFMFGMTIASDGLQRGIGRRFRDTIMRLTRNPVLGMIFGTALTFFAQSSGATIVMLMSFVRARMLSLRNSLGMIMGAAIGSSLTVQLISLNLFDYALAGIALGFVIYFPSKSPRIRSIGLTILGFGMIFFGMKVMSEQIAPLKGFPFFREAAHSLGSHPVWAVILSAAFTGFVHSSGATMGMVLALARQNLITVEEAVPIMFGAALGTASTGLLAAIGSVTEAKRIAWAHVIFKLLGILVCMPFIAQLSGLGNAVTRFTMPATSPDSADFAARAVANTYTSFTVIIAMVFLPLIPLLDRTTRYLIPGAADEADGDTRAKYLDPDILDTPMLALGSVLREISRMGRFLEEMMRQTSVALFEKNEKVLGFIRERDNKVDGVNRQVTRFLTNLNQRTESEEESSKITSLLYIVSDLESIGDVVDKNLLPLAEKMIANSLEFSEEGRDDLHKLHQKVSERLSQMLISLTTGQTELAGQIISAFEFVQNEGRRMHLRHLQRLQSGLPESIETSSVHLDVINYLMRLDYLTYNICLYITGKTTAPGVPHHI